MKKTRKVALGGMIAALSVVVMLAAWFPYLTVALPAFAGMLLLIILREMGARWAALVYAAVGLLALLMCEREATVLYIFLFGPYPILKTFFDRLRPRPLRILVKFLCFNVACVIGYALVIYAFRVPVDDMGLVGEFGPWFLLGMMNLALLPYDYCLTSGAVWYDRRLRSRLLRLFR